nr:hypothetical protein CFP56_67186 [Quercus suber]
MKRSHTTNIGFQMTNKDPGPEPARHVWSSINAGTEIYVSGAVVTAEWSVSDFDVLVPEDVTNTGSSFD